MNSNLLFVGRDKYGRQYSIGIPDMLVRYKLDMVAGISSSLSREYTTNKIITTEFLNIMVELDTLHLFLLKHMKDLIETISESEEIFERKIKDECMIMFNIEKEDEAFNTLYERFKKGSVVKSIVKDYLEEKLESYILRLKEVEL